MAIINSLINNLVNSIVRVEFGAVSFDVPVEVYKHWGPLPKRPSWCSEPKWLKDDYSEKLSFKCAWFEEIRFKQAQLLRGHAWASWHE